MIDRKALEEVATRHFGEMAAPEGVSLTLVLHNGERHTVNAFSEFHDGYCVVLVYPADPLDEDDLGTTIPKDAQGKLIFDRLILPYGAIAYVSITARDAEKRATIGFHA